MVRVVTTLLIIRVVVRGVTTLLGLIPRSVVSVVTILLNGIVLVT